MTITFLSNGGAGGPTEQRFKGNTHVLIADEKPTKAGYHFVGWTRIEGSNEPMYFAGEWASQPFTQDTTLYACWEKYNPNEPFTVQANKGETLNYGGVFELIGGSAGVKSITIEHNYRLIKGNDESYDIFCSLQTGDISITPEDYETCYLAFNAQGEENRQVVEKYWPNGPTAAKTMDYIDQLSNQPGEHPELESWNFYLGWRVEYEYACFIQMILEDQI